MERGVLGCYVQLWALLSIDPKISIKHLFVWCHYDFVAIMLACPWKLGNILNMQRKGHFSHKMESLPIHYTMFTTSRQWSQCQCNIKVIVHVCRTVAGNLFGTYAYIQGKFHVPVWIKHPAIMCSLYCHLEFVQTLTACSKMSLDKCLSKLAYLPHQHFSMIRWRSAISCFHIVMEHGGWVNCTVLNFSMMMFTTVILIHVLQSTLARSYKYNTYLLPPS